MNRQIERHLLLDDGLVPNNARLPLIVYRRGLDVSGASAAARALSHFEANGWSNGWIDGIYDFHHYHATTHEVLGIVAGRADVQFGGPAGPVLTVVTGDAVLIPAGVGHCLVRGSNDLSVVGAYPGGVDWDLVRARPEARPAALAAIARVPSPTSDPVYGGEGPATSETSRDA